MNPDTYSKRFYAALMVSCLLHAALIFLPYVGANRIVSRPAMQGGQKPARARILNATLVRESEPAATVAENSVAGASAADLPARPLASEEPRPALNPATGIDVLPIPAPTFYTTDQLTKRPQPISDPNLDTPEIAPIFASGTVVLKLWINELGAVVSVDLEQSDLPEEISATAVAAFGKLRFVPGEINGRPVGTMMRIEVTYDDSTTPP